MALTPPLNLPRAATFHLVHPTILFSTPSPATFSLPFFSAIYARGA